MIRGRSDRGERRVGRRGADGHGFRGCNGEPSGPVSLPGPCAELVPAGLQETKEVIGGQVGSYQEWRLRVVRDIGDYGGVFWEIIDFSWSPAEQNRLARLWKAGNLGRGK